MAFARRQRIEEICDAALALNARERTAFIAAECGDDVALRREVEALLAHAERAEQITVRKRDIVSHAADTLSGLTLTPATRIGPYEVVRRIGVGGMGEVYEAVDTALRRRVAIKVLPEIFAHDTERLA